MNIKKTLAAVVFLLVQGGAEADGQELAMRDSWQAPFVNVPSLYDQDTLTVCFLGDMMMHTNQIADARNGQDFDFSPYFKLLEDKISEADIAVANMEFTLAGEPYSGYPEFSAPDSYARYMAEIGIDIFLAANNHIFDKGSEGTARTLEIYRKLEDSHGIKVAGIAESEEARQENHPLVIRRKGMTLAFINFTYGTNLGGQLHWPKTNYMRETHRLQEALEKAEAEADMTIVLPHWGPEYELMHSRNQEETAEWLAGNGADLIIGTHPHVVQDTAKICGVTVAYSLGNAVSNMSAANTQLELMAVQKIVRKGNGDIELLPLELIWLWCSRPGGFGNSYTVIPVEEYLGRREEWSGAWDYDKMVSTYERITKQLKH